MTAKQIIYRTEYLNKFKLKKLEIKDKIKIVANGDNHIVLVTNKDEIFGYGSNEDGQLGMGEVETVRNLTRIDGFGNIKTIECGDSFTIIVNEDNEIYASGLNYFGIENQNSLKKFTKINPNNNLQENIISIRCGFNFLYLITDNNGLYGIASLIFRSKKMSKEEKKDTTTTTPTTTKEDKTIDKDEDEKKDTPINPLDLEEIAIIKRYGQGAYFNKIKDTEDALKKMVQEVNELCGVKESDTGLANPSLWDIQQDRATLQHEMPLQVARCTKIIEDDEEEPKYLINVRQIAKYVVGLGENVAPTDIEEGMRIGVDRTKYQIRIPLPPKIDASVTMMTVEEKPDITYNDIGGSKEQIEKIREVVELPLLHPERFTDLGIDPPKGVLLYGPPGTGKTLLARAVANRTDATFIRVIGSELVQKYVGEGARMVRELFQMARQRKACIIFFDEVDAIGGTRFDDGAGGDNEVQRTMLEIVNQLDGFESRGNIKVLMATNRPDILDPALMRPGRLDRKIEFGLPDLEARTHIFKIHAKNMNVEKDIRYELLARLCPNSTGADIRSVCTEAGMFAIRARRKTVSEKDMLDAINKVIKGYQRFSTVGYVESQHIQ
ncbi:hypothetical protein ABK040_005328 [Willaertia magna]